MMLPRNMLARTVIVLVLSLALGMLAFKVARDARGETRVIDGDTIVLDGERVRIFALDCPEMRDPGGPEAKKALQNLLRGSTVSLKRKGHDRYGRTVAIVFAGHPMGFRRDVARRLIASGTCKEYCVFSRRGHGKEGKYGTCR